MENTSITDKVFIVSGGVICYVLYLDVRSIVRSCVTERSTRYLQNKWWTDFSDN